MLLLLVRSLPPLHSLPKPPSGTLSRSPPIEHRITDLLAWPKAAAGTLAARVNQYLNNYKQLVPEAWALKLTIEAQIDEKRRGFYRVR